jgi:hypothetical protein
MKEELIVSPPHLRTKLLILATLKSLGVMMKDDKTQQ